MEMDTDEIDYDCYEKQRVLEELKIIFEIAWLCRSSQTKNCIKELFFFIEQTAALDWIAEKDLQYNEPCVCCNCYDKHTDFVNKTLCTGPSAYFNAWEICIHYCMSQKAFYQLWNATTSRLTKTHYAMWVKLGVVMG